MPTREIKVGLAYFVSSYIHIFHTVEMAAVEKLRSVINERLAAAADEIFGVFAQALSAYEEEICRQRRLLDTVLKPQIQLHRTELPQQHVCNEEEVLTDQQLCSQERNSSLDQEDPEPPQIKEEQEELCTSQEEEQFELKQETDAFMVTLTDEESVHSGQICAKESVDKPQIKLNRTETEIVTLDLQVIPTSSLLNSALSVSESRSTSSGTPNSSPSQLLAIALFSSQAGNRDSSNRPSTSQVLKTWPETFQVPWEQMPQEIRSAILSGKRPKPTERRQMVRILVDEMRRYEANPTRSQCLTVIRNIIRQYPKSFADMTADWSLLGCGYTSLLIQVKNRIENVNRGGNYAHHRASRSSSTYKRGPTDTYGCTRFQPELPPEETNETVEQNRQRLVEIYRQEGAGGVERAEVKNQMELTFCLQRRHINELPPPDIENMRSKWPFLFTQMCIYAHFELLTDINVLRSMELSMVECGRAITEYFRGKPTNRDVKDVLSNCEDNEMALCVVQLLMAHFGEDLTGLVLLTNVSATAADVETTLTLPASPRLILLGGTGQVTTGRWMITLEGRVISEGITPTFLTGLAAVFAIYYIFNLQYQEEAACTLEFIQRRFIGINPERGTKAIRGKVVCKKTGVIVQKKSATVNTNVSTLLKNLLDFESD
ncbi:uncharacterized protein [Pseudochaenichthys georgianus]|uniref:uncharacterized protein isoform X2 n=1 Tax=Pseudochaenichthys georgianus TaxID=52239 RepID=UPI00146E8E3B|nr:uncharacterized protein LOC117452035 isoform X2 [Pseudochaenichthys georgianus]